MSHSRSTTPITENVRRCGICFENFASTVVPKVLPCGHSFCEECVIRTALNAKIICPSCRDEHDVPDSGFPTNFHLQEVLAASEDQPEPDEPVSQSAAFQIFVRNMAGNNVSVFVEADELIEDVKLKIRDRTGTHPVQQRLIFEGKQLENDKTVKFYNIRKANTIHLVLRLKGGMTTGACKTADSAL